MFWTVPQMWLGKTVFVLGGGPSLKCVDLSPLRDRRVIGCNDAYQFGHEIVDLCWFMDSAWFVKHKKTLSQFRGLKASCHAITSSVPWILTMHATNNLELFPYNRQLISRWTNTGFSAINLAWLLGAKRIVLVGFDMRRVFNEKIKDTESNWHVNNLDKNDATVYRRFLDAAPRLAAALKKTTPDLEVLNATPGSDLHEFPMTTLEEQLR
jgi:hypothetical protein